MSNFDLETVCERVCACMCVHVVCENIVTQKSGSIGSTVLFPPPTHIPAGDSVMSTVVEIT